MMRCLITNILESTWKSACGLIKEIFLNVNRGNENDLTPQKESHCSGSDRNVASPKRRHAAFIIHVQKIHIVHLLDNYNKIYKMHGTYIKKVYIVTVKQNCSAR